ncbi:MAG: lysylphosphatidylglycerol synthase transmembrane domain-containing protein [Planctomycetota bacterium]
MTKRTRKTILTACKVLLAAVLLAYVVSKVPLHDYTDAQGRQRQGFLSTLATARWDLVALSAAAFLTSLLITGLRWWYLLRVQEIRISLWEGTRLTFLGLFFNAVIPGTVGGDLVKAYYAARHTSKKAAVLVTGFVDRILGLAELTCMGAVMISASWLVGVGEFASLRLAAMITAGVAVGLVVALVFLLSPRVRRILHLQKIYRRLPIAHHIEAAGSAARVFGNRLTSLLKAIGITFASHCLFISAIALLGAAVGVPAPWYAYFLYIPVIYIVGAVPVTPGGVGIIESFYLLFFSGYFAGVDSGHGEAKLFALAMLARFIPFLWGLPGALVAVTGARLPKTEAMEAELGITGDVTPLEHAGPPE